MRHPPLCSSGGRNLEAARDAARLVADESAVELDAAGPVAMSDMKRLHHAVPATLVFRDGRRTWLSEDDAHAQVPATDGRVLTEKAYSPILRDRVHAATAASDVRFDLAVRSLVEAPPR